MNGSQYLKVAIKHRPQGVIVRFCQPQGVHGRYNYCMKIVESPRPNTAETLLTMLHEFAHAELHSDRNLFSGVPYHVTEQECDEWALNRFREEGLNEDAEKLLGASRDYIFEKIGEDFALFKGIGRRALGYLTCDQQTQIKAQYERYLEEKIPSPFERKYIDREYQGWHSPLQEFNR